MPVLIDRKLRDGSRVFWEQARSAHLLDSDIIFFSQYLKNTLDFSVAQPVTDGFSEAYIDFQANGFAFQLYFNNAYWEAISQNPACPEKILQNIAEKIADMFEPMRTFAREHGEFGSQAQYRVVVSEQGAKITCTDFIDLQRARQYAADCRWETENGPVTATIFDQNFEKMI